MQTFLASPNFTTSAIVLDYKRLGKQRVEAYQIIRILSGESKSKAWRHHPAVLMWKGYEKALCLYAISICIEWRSRGYKDTLLERFGSYLKKYDAPTILPPWLGGRIHSSHRSNLLRKSDYYKRYHWKESKRLKYFWPISIQNTDVMV